MLVKKINESLVVLDKQKLLSIKNKKYECLKNNKICYIKNKKNKKIYSFETVANQEIMKNPIYLYSFLEKKDLIEKLELNLGSLLHHNDVLHIERTQFPMFNLLFEDILLASYDLQKIYINYFIRLLLKERIFDIIIDKEDYDRYDKCDKSEQVTFNQKTRFFGGIKEKEDFLEILDIVSKTNEKVNIEGVMHSNSYFIKKITLFNQYKLYIVTE